MLAEIVGHRLAEVRRARGLTQQQVADRMGAAKARISQIERGKVSGHDVLARYATALGGRLHQASRPPSRPATSSWTSAASRSVWHPVRCRRDIRRSLHSTQPQVGRAGGAVVSIRAS